jgi:hypothetical protein
MERAYSTSEGQAGPAVSRTRSSSRVSSASSGARSARSSISSARSSSADSRRGSGTAFLSGARQRQVIEILITGLAAVPGDESLCTDASYTNLSYIPDGNLISLRVPPPQTQNPDLVVKIPLALCDYDRNDPLAKACLRWRNFKNCRISWAIPSSNNKDGTGFLRRRPLFTVDAGEAWGTEGEMRVIDYSERGFPCCLLPKGIMFGNFRLKNKRHDLSINWSQIDFEDVGDRKEMWHFSGEPDHIQRRMLAQWIKEGKLVARNVVLNSFGRPVSADIGLL